MLDSVTDLIKSLHKSKSSLVYVCAGAGTDALGTLFSAAGASNTVLECLVPYSKPSFEQFLGRKPDRHVSERAALQLAGRALTRAQLLAKKNRRLIGVACTAAIVTEKEKRGKHRAYIATWQAERIVVRYVELAKGMRTRVEEEAVVSSVVLNMIANAAGLSEQVAPQWLENDHCIETCYDTVKAAKQLYAKETPYFGVHDFGRIRFQDASPQILFPGSFNPLHAGHLALAKAAEEFLGKPVAFEISAFNVDKPPLRKKDALERLAQFAGHHSIYLSSAATFLDKSRIFGATTFVVGQDTAARIVMTKYYDSEVDMLAALTELRDNGCRFVVAPRQADDGQLKTALDIPVPDGFREMFVELPDFRVDVSSSALRAKGDRGSR